MTPILQAPDGPAGEPISDATLSWMAAITFLPPLFTAMHMGALINKFGRKPCLAVTSAFLSISWLITCVSLHPWALLTSRAIAGMACATCYVVTPLYLKEIAAEDKQGRLGSMFILAQNVGYLMVYIWGEVASFNVTMFLCTSVPILHMSSFILLPDTPVFSIKQGKLEEARINLAFMLGTKVDDPAVQKAMTSIQAEIESSKSVEDVSFRSLISDKTRRKAFIIATILMLIQESCGYLVVLTYAGTIFEQASSSINLTLSPNVQTIMVGGVQVLGSIVACCIVERTGRKWLVIVASLVTGLAMQTLAWWFKLTADGVPLPGWVPVIAMCVCIFADAAGFQPVPYVIMSELFYFRYRAFATSLITSGTALSDFIQTKAYDPLVKLIGIHWVFMGFSVICFLGTFFAIVWVPETKGKTLEEIYAMLEGPIDEQEEARAVGEEVTRL